MSVASFANIFSHSEGCLFVLFMASFAVQKLLSLIRSHLLFVVVLVVCSLFCFNFHYPRRWIKKRPCCNLCQSVLSMFSSKSFIESSLTFRSLINFEFIFVYGVRECSNFILYM